MSTIKTPVFEHVTCTRCGGSGKYSFNLMHGSRCYGCSGTGYKLTKRGAAAQSYLNAMRQIPIEQFKVGDLILLEGFSAGSLSVASKWGTVEKVTLMNGEEAGYVGHPEYECCRIDATCVSFTGFVGKTTIRKGFTGAEKKAQLEAALAYQATLTKVGKPRKSNQEVAA